MYQGKIVTLEMIEGYAGFCYLITNKLSGKKYVGKKLLEFKRRKKVKGKTRRKVVTFESDWKTYYGSSKELCEDVKIHGEENFIREILRFCSTKSECNYHEAREILVRDAIILDSYYNAWLSVRVHNSSAL